MDWTSRCHDRYKHEDGFKDAALLGPIMEGKIYIGQADKELDSNTLLSKLNTEGCGAIVSFIGITRGFDQGEEVLRLEFDAWKDQLTTVLEGLAIEGIKRFNLHSVAMSHRTGSVGPGENIVAIHVASAHRKQAFEGCQWLIDELKLQAPIWKKEVKPSGETWKAGLG
ncbi:MAG TPA: molybdenum cofactor biosynthesis protein MoaE [Candidatus Poseidoniales archaeon]|jgi:molybdopterin synthase catalytic subunit|nr:molybdenum cofactor biosynthesis protein MoaE [Candidatus Poseidoniales archaeon]